MCYPSLAPKKLKISWFLPTWNFKNFLKILESVFSSSVCFILASLIPWLKRPNDEEYLWEISWYPPIQDYWDKEHTSFVKDSDVPISSIQFIINLKFKLRQALSCFKASIKIWRFSHGNIALICTEWGARGRWESPLSLIFTIGLHPNI